MIGPRQAGLGCDIPMIVNLTIVNLTIRRLVQATSHWLQRLLRAQAVHRAQILTAGALWTPLWRDDGFDDCVESLFGQIKIAVPEMR
eukprot:COSAG01_NODE_1786_length_9231_cov_19.575276_5_plen_87_part_00